MSFLTDWQGREHLKIGIGTDHGGFQLKTNLIAAMTKLGYEMVDMGPYALDNNDDYTDYAVKLAKAFFSKKIP